MKRIIMLSISTIIVFQLKAQVLLENKNGDELFRPVLSLSDAKEGQLTLAKINTGDQSLSIDYFKMPKPESYLKYKFWSLGVKAKPTDGVAPIFTNGQFSPGITASASKTWFTILDKEATMPANGFADWGTVSISYTTNKYLLFDSDTTFNQQLTTKAFEAVSLNLFYNMLIKSEYLISLKVGAQRSNNFNELKSLEVVDVKTITGSNGTNREITTKKTAREGSYLEFDSYPVSFAVSKLPEDGGADKTHGIGYTFYSAFRITSLFKPVTNLGAIIFITETKNKINTPKIGLNVQANDFFDVRGSNNGFQKRLSLGLTTSFTFM